MAETYTSGLWRVKSSHDDEFVKAWEDIVSWARDQPGSGTFRLVRDVEDPDSHPSFAPWESFEAQRDWKATEEFSVQMRRVREHLVSFEPSTYEPVAEVG